MDFIEAVGQGAGAMRGEEQGPGIGEVTLTYHLSYPDGDLVLLSKDGVHFRVHSVILKLASFFFRDMLGIPRSLHESAGDPIPMDENADIISAILDIIYPNSILREEAAIRDVQSFAEELAAAADKYDFPAVSAMVKRALFSKTGEVPSVIDRWSAIRRYDLAERYDWTEEARVAMNWTLHYNLTSPEATLELRRVSDHSIFLLQNLHKKRLQIFKESLTVVANGDDLYRSNAVTHRCRCTVAGSVAWSHFVHKVTEQLTSDPLGSRLLDRETWDERAYAQIFEIVHGPMCVHGRSNALLLPPKSRFVTKAQAALKSLPTFI